MPASNPSITLERRWPLAITRFVAETHICPCCARVAGSPRGWMALPDVLSYRETPGGGGGGVPAGGGGMLGGALAAGGGGGGGAGGAGGGPPAPRGWWASCGR